MSTVFSVCLNAAQNFPPKRLVMRVNQSIFILHRLPHSRLMAGASLVGRHLFPSRCQLDRTSFTFCLCFDTVPYGPTERARNTKYIGERQTAASDWQTQHEYFNNCSILDADIFVLPKHHLLLKAGNKSQRSRGVEGRKKPKPSQSHYT